MSGEKTGVQGEEEVVCRESVRLVNLRRRRLMCCTTGSLIHRFSALNRPHLSWADVRKGARVAAGGAQPMDQDSAPPPFYCLHRLCPPWRHYRRECPRATHKYTHTLSLTISLPRLRADWRERGVGSARRTWRMIGRWLAGAWARPWCPSVTVLRQCRKLQRPKLQTVKERQPTQ